MNAAAQLLSPFNFFDCVYDDAQNIVPAIESGLHKEMSILNSFF